MRDTHYQVLLVRYGEIVLKSPRVRARMERALVHNIASHLRRSGISNFRISKEGGRIFIRAPEVSDALRVICKVFGVISASPAHEASLDLEELKKSVVQYAIEILKDRKSFAVRVHRANKKYPYTSPELARILGAAIIEAMPTLKVNLEEPDREVWVEIRESKAYIFHEIVKGPGGLPYGVEGKVVALVSGGNDSAVAAWMVMKRGCAVVPLFCDMTPYFEGEGYERAIAVLKILREWVPTRRWRVYVAPLGNAHKKVEIEPRYRCLLCKILMYKIAERIAFSEEAKAIVTGESLGQVASQTLDNLHFMSRFVSLPILRPVIGMDKLEIEEIARKIGVYSVAARRVGCKLVPKHPETHADKKAEEKLSSLDIEGLVDGVMREVKILEI